MNKLCKLRKKIIMISASVRLRLSVSYIYSRVWFVSAALYIKVCVCVCVRVGRRGGFHTEQEVCAIKGSCLHIAKSLQETRLQIRGGKRGVSWTHTLEGAIKNKKRATIMCILVQIIVLSVILNRWTISNWNFKKRKIWFIPALIYASFVVFSKTKNVAVMNG